MGDGDADRVLVRGTERRVDARLLAWSALPLSAGAGILTLTGYRTTGAVVAAVAVLCGLAGIALMARRDRRRLWLRDTGNAFVLTDREGERTVKDDDVLSISLIRADNYFQGELKSVTRRLVLWLPSDEPKPERIELTTKIPVGQPDPLAGLIDRLADRLLAQARQDLDAGREVLGEVWSIGAGELGIRQKKEVRACPLTELVAAEVVGSDLCLWRRGQDEPFAKVPLRSANAYILGRLLADRLADQSAEPTPRSDGGLGRIIFERRPGKHTAPSLVVTAVVLGVGAALFAVRFGAGPGNWLAAASLGGACGACLVGAYYSRRVTFQCRDLGIHKYGLLGPRTLRYADIEAFTCQATRVYNHGVYQGTRITMTFEPVAARKGQQIRLIAIVRNADAALDALRDQVSRMIGSRMAEKLAAGEPVDWTPHLRFRPDGLECRPFSLFGRYEPVVVPYADLQRFEIKDGTFRIWAKDRAKPVVTESTSARNFFPGYFLLSTMAAPPAPTTNVSADTESPSAAVEAPGGGAGS